MNQTEPFHKALQLTQECLQLVHQGDFDQFVVLESERRSAMQFCLDNPNPEKLPLMNELQKASQALERELLEAMGAMPLTVDNPYNSDDSGSGYSIQA